METLVDDVRAAGRTSVYAKSPLQRHFRDVHDTKQAMVGADLREDHRRGAARGGRALRAAPAREVLRGGR